MIVYCRIIDHGNSSANIHYLFSWLTPCKSSKCSGSGFDLDLWFGQWIRIQADQGKAEASSWSLDILFNNSGSDWTRFPESVNPYPKPYSEPMRSKTDIYQTLQTN